MFWFVVTLKNKIGTNQFLSMWYYMVDENRSPCFIDVFFIHINDDLNKKNKEGKFGCKYAFITPHCCH